MCTILKKICIYYNKINLKNGMVLCTMPSFVESFLLVKRGDQSLGKEPASTAYP